MAKNTVNKEELSVEDKLRSLHKLQQIDSQTDEIRKLRGELPLEVEDLEDEVAGLQTRIAKYDEELKENTASIAAKKNEIQEHQTLIEKYTKQQDNVRKKKDTLKEAKAQLKEKTGLLKEKKAELKALVAETAKEEEKLMKESNLLLADLDENLGTAYQRIRKNARNGLAVRIRKNARNGLAVVTVNRDACGGCFNKIPPQRQLDIRARKKIIVCEHCGRILVDKYINETDNTQELKDLEAAKQKKKRTVRKKVKKEA